MPTTAAVTPMPAFAELDRSEKVTWLKKHGVSDAAIFDALLTGGDDALVALAER